MKINIEIPKEKLADFCRKWKIVELRLFGSVLRDATLRHNPPSIAH